MQVKTTKISARLFRIEKEYKTTRSGFGNDISGPFWMLIWSKTTKAEFWRVDGELVSAPSNPKIIYVPPYSWTAEFVEAGTRTEVLGYISSTPPSRFAPTRPCFLHLPGKITDIESGIDAFFRNARAGGEISVRTNPSPLSARAKALIDRSYPNGILLDDVAKKLRTSRAQLSRQFKKDFYFPPKYYERGLRVTHAMFLLLMGEAPATAAFAAGYRDLGRFYKQFGEFMKTTPKSHQRKRSKNAKK